MRIRAAARADLPLLAGIEATGDAQFREHFGYDPGFAAPHTGRDRATVPGFLLVADLAEGDAAPDVAGFVHVLELDGVAHLEQVSVHGDHQRRGIGRALVEAAKGRVGEKGYAELSLLTYADVPWNAPFYATCGFAVTEPTGALHRRFRDIEVDLGLDRHGRRVLMVAPTAPREVRHGGVSGE